MSRSVSVRRRARPARTLLALPAVPALLALFALFAPLEPAFGSSGMAPGPAQTSPPALTLAQAFERAWARQPEAQAAEFVGKLYKNVPVLAKGGRDATATFLQRNIGDVLITFESEVVSVEREFGKGKVASPSWVGSKSACRMSFPMGRPEGSAVKRARCPVAWSVETRRRAWVVLPEPSRPSTTMKRPLDTRAPPLTGTGNLPRPNLHRLVTRAPRLRGMVPTTHRTPA